MALSAELEGFEARHGKFREMNVFLFVSGNFCLEVSMTLLEQQVLGPVFS